MMREMQDQERQGIMKRRADAAKQFLDSMPPEVQAAFKAQGIECQTPPEPASQFPPRDCSPPIVGLSLQRLKTHDNREDDQ